MSSLIRSSVQIEIRVRDQLVVLSHALYSRYTRCDTFHFRMEISITHSPDTRDKIRPFSGPPTGEIASESQPFSGLSQENDYPPENDCTASAVTDSAQQKVATGASRRKRRTTSSGSDNNQSKKSARDLSQHGSTDDEHEESMDADVNHDDNFSTAQPRKRRQQRTANQPVINKAPSNRTQLTVYVKGQSANVAKEAIRKPHDFKKEVIAFCGQVDVMEARNDCIRIVCRTAQQRDRLLHLQTIVGKEVKTSKPWSLTNERPASKTANVWKKGVITRVPTSFTDQIIKEDSGAIMVRRITRMTDGQAVATSAVISGIRGYTAEGSIHQPPTIQHLKIRTDTNQV